MLNICWPLAVITLQAPCVRVTRARFRNPVLGGRHQGLCAPGTPAEKQHREAAQKHELHKPAHTDAHKITTTAHTDAHKN